MDFKLFPDIIVQGIVQSLPVEDRLCASLMSKRFRAEVVHRESMRDIIVTVVSSEQVSRMSEILELASNVEICCGRRLAPFKEDVFVEVLRNTLIRCNVLEYLDLSKCRVSVNDFEDSARIASSIDFENAGQLKELRTSWYFTRSQCFTKLLASCTSLERLMLTEPTCRFNLNDSSRQHLANIRFDSALSDSALVLSHKFFEFLSSVADFGINVDQFLAGGRGPQSGNQLNLQANLLHSADEAFQKHKLSALSLPRTTMSGYDDTFYRIISHQKHSLKQLKLDLTSFTEVQRIAELIRASNMRGIEIVQRNAELGRSISKIFLADSAQTANANNMAISNSSQLTNVSLSGVRWKLIPLLTPVFSNLRALTLSQVELQISQFHTIGRECTKLQRLRLVQCIIDSFSLKHDEQQSESIFTALTSLEVYECPMVLESSFESFQVPSLRKFALHFCSPPEPSCVIWRHMADNMPLLTSVSLKHRIDCVVPDERMVVIFNSIARLRCLRFLRSFRYRTAQYKHAASCAATRCFGVSSQHSHTDTQPEDFLDELTRNFRFLRVELCEC